MTAAPSISPSHFAQGAASESLAAVGLRLDLVETTAQFLRLEEDWNRLAKLCATKTPFMNWDWVRLWWEKYSNRFELIVGVARDARSGVIRGIAPLIIGRRLEGVRRYLRQVGFMGSFSEVVSEGMDFLVAEGDEELVSAALARTFAHTRSRWDAVHLQVMHAESPSALQIMAALAECGVGAATLNVSDSRFIAIPETWDAYARSRSPNWRSQYRRKARRFFENHQGKVLVAGRDVEYSIAYDEFLRCHAMQWVGGGSSFFHPVVKDFHRNLVERWVPSGRILMLLLEMDGRVGGAAYCFREDNRLWYYNTGWDPSFQRISAGQLVLGETLKWGIENGLRSIELLPGDYDYKIHWGKGCRRVMDIECFNSGSMRARIFRLMRGIKRLYTNWREGAASASGNGAGARKEGAQA